MMFTFYNFALIFYLISKSASKMTNYILIWLNYKDNFDERSFEWQIQRYLFKIVLKKKSVVNLSRLNFEQISFWFDVFMIIWKT
jgi:hypothetical protein